eukprot:TRINITY_DN9382_c0_g1_i2.p1 TRINITY_DN9382_c0_g1~~TRINITY_DN9382_c0_g1_i2.p1  ORF type:complete len:595 (+),score=114.41 TRINITY_DN9382_c0_g1_i2:522-2306(+)
MMVGFLCGDGSSGINAEYGGDLLLQFLIANSFNLSSQPNFTISHLKDNLIYSQTRLENELRMIPRQVLELRSDPNFAVSSGYNFHSDAYFFIALLRKAQLFGTLEQQKSQKKTHFVNCAELADYLLDEPSVATYLEKVYFFKQNFFFKTVQSEAQVEMKQFSSQPKQVKFGRPQDYTTDGNSSLEDEDEEYQSLRDLHDPPVANKMKEQIVFSQPSIVYKDRSIINSFALNSADSNLVVIATASGLKEFDIRNVDSTLNREFLEEVPRHPTRSASVSQFSINNQYAPTELLTSPIPARRLVTERAPSLDHQDTSIWCLQSHPKLPHYLSGSLGGAVKLWQWNIPTVVGTYPNNHSKSRVNSIRFSTSGTKFGACMNDGWISLWRWSEQDDTVQPYRCIKCYSVQCRDMMFLNTGSYFATAGQDEDVEKRTIKFWDTLLTPSKSNVWSCSTPTDGIASSLVYSPKQSLMFCGFKKGGIMALDLRKREILKWAEKSHTGNCCSLSLDPFNENFLVSGSTDGSVKVWDIRGGDIQLIENRRDVHKEKTFIHGISSTNNLSQAVTTRGVMQVMLTQSSQYSCGSDGILLQRSVFYALS